MGDDIITLSECTEEGLAFFSVHGEEKADVLRRFHLYKAAPDLLEALKEMLVSHDSLYHAAFDDTVRGIIADPNVDIIRRNALAALAKAEQP